MELTDLTLFYNDLPQSYDPLRIVHISDMHTRGLGRAEQALFGVLEQGGDLLICSGDSCSQLRFGNPFYDHHRGRETEHIGLSREGLIFPHKVNQALTLWDQILTHTEDTFPLGIVTVQGNHDPGDFIKALAQRPRITILNNQHHRPPSATEPTPPGIDPDSASSERHPSGTQPLPLGIPPRTPSTEPHSSATQPLSPGLVLYGLRSFRFNTIDLFRAIRGIGPDEFTIGICHYPDLAEVMAAMGTRLILAGHTHGGQVALPNGRPIITHCITGDRYARGLAGIGESRLYTNRGMGTSTLALRLNCPAEIARITLRRGRPERSHLHTTPL